MNENDSYLDIAFKLSVIGGSLVLYLMLFILIDKVNNVAIEVNHLPERMQVQQSGPMLPAGIYICDGQQCAVASSGR